MRSSVDLPQPEGPTSTVNAPSAMSMSMPCRTAVAPKFFRTCWIVTLAIGAAAKAALTRAARSICIGAEPRHEGKPVDRAGRRFV